MGLDISFSYQNKTYTARILFAFNQQPCLLFVTLSDAELAKEFPKTFSIVTDGDSIQESVHEASSLSALKLAIFNAARQTREFILMKKKYMQLNKKRQKEKSPLHT